MFVVIQVPVLLQTLLKPCGASRRRLFEKVVKLA
jgi:hypothetical protein